LSAALPEDVVLRTQGVGGAAQRVEGGELVHVERDRARGQEGRGEDGGGEERGSGASEDGRAQASLPLAIAACTV
jgi:hypothetical protein